MKFLKPHILLFSLFFSILCLTVLGHKGNRKGSKGYVNETLKGEGYIPFYSIRLEDRDDWESNDDDGKDESEKSDFSMDGDIIIYTHVDEMAENKKPTKFVFELYSKDVSPFPSDSSTTSQVDFPETSTAQEISNTKNMFTIIKTRKDVFSMRLEMIKSECLHLIYFTNETGEAPSAKVESNLVYMTLPEEKQTLRREVASKHDGDDKGHHDEHDDDGKDWKGMGKEFLHHSVIDSSVVQYMVLFCPFWKSATENSFTYKLSLELMNDLPYYYGRRDPGVIGSA